MKNQQGAPEALRLADALASNYFDGKQGRDVWDAAAAELRRLHAQVAALTAATEVQAEPWKDKETCQMCGEKPYPGCNSEFQDEAACRFYRPATAQTALAHELFAAAQLTPGEGIEDAVLRLAALVEAQQPAPSAAAAEAQEADAVAKRRAKYLRNDTDAGRAYVAQYLRSMGQHYFDDYIQTDLAGDFACALASALSLSMAQQVPQPSPTPQADSQPAPVVDEREAFEADYLRAFPGKQGRLGRTKRTTSIGYEHAMVQCRWEGWQARAARAPADSVTAPAESDWDVRGHLATSLSFWHRLKNGEDDELVAAFRKWAPPSCTIELDELRKAFRPHDLTQEWTSEHSRNYPGKAARIINAASAAVLTATATPPAQAADSVLEDAARYRWLFGARTDAQAVSVSETVFKPLPQDEVLSHLQGFYMSKAVVDALVDAARKQGGAT